MTMEDSNLPPELIELMMGGATYEEAQAELEKKRALQEQLRYGARSDTGMVGNVAASPLSFVGDLWQRNNAKKEQGRLQGEIDTNRGQEQQRVKGVMGELGKGPAEPMPPTNAPPMDMSQGPPKELGIPPTAMPPQSANTEKASIIAELLKRLGKGA
jgi:hypothetical protein